tara:strand:+ start:405 stop:632 length:228 start_codon:yes stop_codon:yes gene_type:complete
MLNLEKKVMKKEMIVKEFSYRELSFIKGALNAYLGELIEMKEANEGKDDISSKRSVELSKKYFYEAVEILQKISE